MKKTMDENQRNLLKLNLDRIVLDLDTDDILSFLLSTLVFDEDELSMLSSSNNKSENSMIAEKYRIEKAEKLIKVVISNGHKESFFSFYDALRYGEYHHLADVLISGVVKNFRGCTYNEQKLKSKSELLPRIKTISRNGGVPDLPRVFVNRPVYLEQLGDGLQYLKDNKGSIVVHGMTGCGKTLMAIKILHDENLVQSCFPDGIFWLSLGNINETSLLKNLQNLIFLMTRNAQTPLFVTLKDALIHLKKLFAKFPHSLLILDDVCCGIGLKCLNLHVRTLITTQNLGISDKISLHKIKVPVSKALSLKQCRQLFAKWLNCQISELPHKTDLIIKEYECYPLAIAMIGALWKSDKYNFSSKNKKKSSKEHIESPLIKAIASSIQLLPKKLKEKYKTMCIFEEDVGVSLDVLSKYWKLDIEKCRNIINEFIERSLILKKNDLYSCHKVQLRFLKANASVKQIVQYQNVFIKVYSKQCKGNLFHLENDGYIHWHLISHLIRANRISQAFDLLTNLFWLQNAVDFTSIPCVIKCFNDVEKFIELQQSGFSTKILSDFKKFILTYSHFVTTNNSIDIIQLALSCQSSLPLYNLALNCASVKYRDSNKDGFYFENKSNFTISNEMYADCKFKNGYCCKFSNNGKHMVSFGDDNIVRIWQKDTSEELLIFKGHTDVVNHCEFSPDDMHIVSCSDDCTVRVWSQKVTKEIFCLESHKEGVLCCRFAPNGTFIVSASLDGTVKIWSFQTGSLLYTMEKHSDVVNWCCISLDSSLVVSCSNDLTLLVWSIKEKQIVTSIVSNKDFFSCCTFFSEGVLGSSLNCISFYSLIDGQELWTIDTNSPILFFAVSPNQKYIASSHSNLSLNLYELETRVLVKRFNYDYPFNRIDFCPNSKSIVTSSLQGFCQILNIDLFYDDITYLPKDFNAIYLDDKQFAAVSTTNQNHVKLLDSNGSVLTSDSFKSKIVCCALNDTAKWLALGMQDGVINILETCVMKTFNTLSRHTGKITHVSFDGKKLLSSSIDKLIIVWCFEQNVSTSILKGHSDILTTCFFMDNALKVVSSSYDGHVCIWNVRTEEMIVSFAHDQSAVLACKASNSKDLLLTGTADATCRLWDSHTGKLLWIDEEHSDAIRSVAFSDDDDVFATGSDDGIVRIWDAKSFDVRFELKTNDGWVLDIKFSVPAGTVLVLTDNARWFSLHDGSILQTFHINGSRLESFFCTKNFDRFITLDSSGRVHVMARIL